MGRENDGTGLYDFRFRTYDPVLKRFVTEHPKGLAAGLNFYAFVDGDPVSNTDPLGLATFQCTRKLDNVPFRVGPLYHQYVCTGNAQDGYSCGGLGPSGANPFNSAGKIERDEYSSQQCEKTQDDNACIEICIQKKLKEPAPNYSLDLSRGENCQTYAPGIEMECVAKCRAGR